MGRQETPFTRALAAKRLDAIEVRAINWCIWKAALPAVSIAALFPVYRYVMTLEFPFSRAFAHGDFILFAAVLLFEVGVEADWGYHQPRYLRVFAAVTKFTAALLIGLYWSIRHDVIEREEALARASAGVLHQRILEKLSNYAWLSCGVAAVSLVCAALLLAGVVDYQKSEELRELGVST